MITSDDKLLILEEFRIDRTLPKYQKQDKNKINIAKNTFIDPIDIEFMEENNLTENDVEGMMDDGYYVPMGSGRPKLIRRSRTNWLKKSLRWFNAKKEETSKTLSVPEFFLSIKNSCGEIRIVEDRAKGYEKALTLAKASGQAALYEQLKDGLNSVLMEAHLASIGITKYVEEANIVRFYKQSKKGLKLSWVKNYIRQIPSNIIALKVLADGLGIFDNYAVLYYDPKAKSYAETEEEKLAKKDPILFGLMKGRRQLYIVGDWVDKFCDLTVDQLAEQIGQDAIKETNSFENKSAYRD